MDLRQQFSRARAVLGILHGSRAFGGPIQANLGLTNRCNIRCIHCYYYSPFHDTPSLTRLRKAGRMGDNPPDKKEMKSLLRVEADSERVKTLISQLLRMGTRIFQLGGNGEPFFYKNVMEIIIKRMIRHVI
jgi:MoaA/NifB/PqqE/SkfB family radical SAM enzyme